MPAPLIRFVLLALGLSLGPGAAKAREETLFLFENRQVTFAMPPGFGFATSKSEEGVFTVTIADKKERAALQVMFLPDPDGRFATERYRKEFLFENFKHLLEASVEKVMQFQELDPRIGSGTYCAFTDEALVGKTKVPAGAFHRSIAGLKTWPGVAAVFTLQSQGTATKEHQALLALLRESVQEIRRG